MTLGSLFDGIGGFPLAAERYGIKAIWASEIEPFPIRVTTLRFPHMKHYGDICGMNGAGIEPVDIITGGSPCQDLSVAGKRAGLAGARSGLFMEQVRIIKEMRSRHGNRPRFMVWENVPGAFSSANGEDFRAVLEETARIAESDVSIPRPADGRWSTAGAILADGWSIAWRVLDAQFWGVPQRRRRIFLVADFGGQSAPEILFKLESVRGHTSEGAAQGEGAAEGTKRGAGTAMCYGIDAAIMTGGHCTAQGPCVYENIQATLKASRPHGVASAVKTLQMREGKAGGGKGPLIQTDQSATLGTGNGQVMFAPKGSGAGSLGDYEEGFGPLRVSKGQEPLAISSPLAVRRLTPLECERLQGFPDGWTGIPKATDSARYKALGNSVAIPCVEYVMKGISEQRKEATP